MAHKYVGWSQQRSAALPVQAWLNKYVAGSELEPGFQVDCLELDGTIGTCSLADAVLVATDRTVISLEKDQLGRWVRTKPAVFYGYRSTAPTPSPVGGADMEATECAADDATAADSAAGDTTAVDSAAGDTTAAAATASTAGDAATNKTTTPTATNATGMEPAATGVSRSGACTTMGDGEHKGEEAQQHAGGETCIPPGTSPAAGASSPAPARRKVATCFVRARDPATGTYPVWEYMLEGKHRETWSSRFERRSSALMVAAQPKSSAAPATLTLLMQCGRSFLFGNLRSAGMQVDNVVNAYMTFFKDLIFAFASATDGAARDALAAATVAVKLAMQATFRVYPKCDRFWKPIITDTRAHDVLQRAAAFCFCERPMRKRDRLRIVEVMLKRMRRRSEDGPIDLLRQPLAGLVAVLFAVPALQAMSAPAMCAAPHGGERRKHSQLLQDFNARSVAMLVAISNIDPRHDSLPVRNLKVLQAAADAGGVEGIDARLLAWCQNSLNLHRDAPLEDMGILPRATLPFPVGLYGHTLSHKSTEPLPAVIATVADDSEQSSGPSPGQGMDRRSPATGAAASVGAATRTGAGTRAGAGAGAGVGAGAGSGTGSGPGTGAGAGTTATDGAAADAATEIDMGFRTSAALRVQRGDQSATVELENPDPTAWNCVTLSEDGVYHLEATVVGAAQEGLGHTKGKARVANLRFTTCSRRGTPRVFPPHRTGVSSAGMLFHHPPADDDGDTHDRDDVHGTISNSDSDSDSDGDSSWATVAFGKSRAARSRSRSRFRGRSRTRRGAHRSSRSRSRSRSRSSVRNRGRSRQSASRVRRFSARGRYSRLGDFLSLQRLVIVTIATVQDTCGRPFREVVISQQYDGHVRPCLFFRFDHLDRWDRLVIAFKWLSLRLTRHPLATMTAHDATYTAGIAAPLYLGRKAATDADTAAAHTVGTPDEEQPTVTDLIARTQRALLMSTTA